MTAIGADQGSESESESREPVDLADQGSAAERLRIETERAADKKREELRRLEQMKRREK